MASVLVIPTIQPGQQPPTTGDWVQVGSDNTLTIPSVYQGGGNTLTIPQIWKQSGNIGPAYPSVQYKFWDFDFQTCDLSKDCACVAYDLTTGMWLAIDWCNYSGGGCTTGVFIGTQKIAPGCSEIDSPWTCQARADAINGQPIGTAVQPWDNRPVFPQWFKDQLSEIDLARPINLAFWTLMCLPTESVILIPNPTPPPPVIEPSPTCPLTCPDGYGHVAAPECCRRFLDPPIPFMLKNLSGKSLLSEPPEPIADTPDIWRDDGKQPTGILESQNSKPLRSHASNNVSTPHSRESTIPMIPMMLPHPDCGCDRDNVDESDVEQELYSE